MPRPCHSRLVCTSRITSHATALTVTTLARVPKKPPPPPVPIGIGAGFGWTRETLQPPSYLCPSSMRPWLSSSVPYDTGTGLASRPCVVGQGVLTLQEVNLMEHNIYSYLEWQLKVDPSNLDLPHSHTVQALDQQLHPLIHCGRLSERQYCRSNPTPHPRQPADSAAIPFAQSRNDTRT